MILAVDIGNTNIVLGCCDKDKILFRERKRQRNTESKSASCWISAALMSKPLRARLFLRLYRR